MVLMRARYWFRGVPLTCLRVPPVFCCSVCLWLLRWCSSHAPTPCGPQAKERKQCPYCRGSGKLPCGNCCTLGSVPSRVAPSAQADCSVCATSGYVECNHCEGTGRLVPIEYERALRAQYESYEYTAEEVDYYSNAGPPYL